METIDIDEEYIEEADEAFEKRQEERAKRRAAMKRQKEIQLRRRRILSIAFPTVLVLLVIVIGGSVWKGQRDKATSTDANGNLEASASTTLTEQNEMENGTASQGEAAQSGAEELSDIEPADVTDNATESGSSIEDTVVENGNEITEQDHVDGKVPLADKVIAKDTVQYSAHRTDRTEGIDEEEITSSYVILFEVESGDIVASKEARTRISPASMTKILTLLVAADYITDLDDTFTMTRDITDYSYSNGCSNVGFDVDEVVTVRDLLYGTILPSGADAAVGLATYVAGSHEAFVELMNEKIRKLGLTSSHMTNCVGLYDQNHYSTVYDIGMILDAAIHDDLCREVLKAHTYVTSSTEVHPDGITISNWFLRRIEDKDTHGEVVCAKTGFVVESRNCAASYAISHAGKEYICVTGDAPNSWRCIYDHVAMYAQYLE